MGSSVCGRAPGFGATTITVAFGSSLGVVPAATGGANGERADASVVLTSRGDPLGGGGGGADRDGAGGGGTGLNAACGSGSRGRCSVGTSVALGSASAATDASMRAASAFASSGGTIRVRSATDDSSAVPISTAATTSPTEIAPSDARALLGFVSSVCSPLGCATLAVVWSSQVGSARPSGSDVCVSEWSSSALAPDAGATSMRVREESGARSSSGSGARDRGGWNSVESSSGWRGGTIQESTRPARPDPPRTPPAQTPTLPYLKPSPLRESRLTTGGWGPRAHSTLTHT